MSPVLAMLRFDMLDILDKPGENRPFRYFVGREGDTQVRLPIYKNSLPENDPPILLEEREKLLARILQKNPEYINFNHWLDSKSLYKSLGIKEIRRETKDAKFCIDGIVLPGAEPTDYDIYCGYMQHNLISGVVLNKPTWEIVYDFPEFSVYRYMLPDGKHFTVAVLRELERNYNDLSTITLLRKTKASFYSVDYGRILPNVYTA